MAQLIHDDSQGMVDQGKTVQKYTDDWLGPNQTIVESTQTFPVNWAKFAWIYVASLNKFFKCTANRHALLRAAREVIGQPRWDEIEDALDEQGPIAQYFHVLDLPRIKRKVLRARDKGLITQAEVTALQGLLP